MHTDTQAQPDSPATPPASLAFPVVGIGASAGGFAALTTLLQNMPAAPGMALVVILHLASDEPSAADKLLQRACDMPVVQVTHTLPILPDHVYVIPPDRSLRMCDGHLVLDRLDRSGASPVAVDIFLRTLAEAHTARAIGIVLSGMGSDGTAGLARIKELGGVTIVQLPSDAAEGGMPRSAIESGMADFVLNAGAIPHKLLELRDLASAIRDTDRRLRQAVLAPDGDPGPHAALDQVQAVLRDRTGQDFMHYKPATLLRGLERRMQVRAVPDLDSYRQLLGKDGAEAQALLKDLLIGVTSFYRDRDAFDALDRRVLPELLKPGAEPLRAWVAACSTGEEAYSIGMLLADRAARQARARGWEMFASDLDAHAIRAARAGLYPDAIAACVPSAQLARYFTREAERYKVRKALRERILFAQHDLLHAPAFSRLDLISCRNFMIYLNQETHRQLLRHFHFALNPGGFLMLGIAESVEAAADLFLPVDLAHRIFRARALPRAARRMSGLPAAPRALAGAPALAAERPAAPEDAGVLAARRRGRLFSFAEIHQQKTVELAPPSVLLNANADIVHVSEAALRYLRQAAGEPTRELAALVLPELQLPLRAALFQARKNGRLASTGPVRCDTGDGAALVDLEVRPFQDPHAEGELLLVRFLPVPLPDQAGSAAPHAAREDGGLLRQLDDELWHTRKRLQDTLEEAETAGDEMRIYAEEMQTVVDELRAGLAELEGSRAELLSSRQELLAHNAELEKRAEDSAKAHDDLVNLVASSDVAAIFLDRDMRIQRYTPRIAELFNVIPADIGRPLPHITNRLDAPRLAEEAAKVFLTLQAMEREVRGKDGRDYIVRVNPYRTIRHRIDGAVMTFFDITSRRAAEQARRESEERFRLFVTASSDILYRMSADWSEMLSLQGKRFLADTDNPSRTWVDTYIPEQDRAQVTAAIQAAIGARSIFELEHRVVRSEGGIGWIFSRAIPLLDAHGEIVEWFGTAVDITGRKRDEAVRRESEARLHTVFESLPAGACVMGADGTTLLSNRIMHRYLPNGVMPSRDRARGGRWRAWDTDGRPLGFDEFPGARALRGERVVPGIEMLFRQDDGREIWTQVASAPVRDRHGRSFGEASVVVTDIDALKRAEATLRDHEAGLRELMSGLALGVWEIDAQDAGAAWIATLHPDDRAPARRSMDQALARRGVVDAAFRLLAPDGAWRPTRVRLVPLFHADGSLRTWVGMSVGT